ncbi:MAG: GIDE domain-containing protein [Terriglobia bacterium]
MVTNGSPDAWLAVGCIFGLVWFARGFQLYRKSLIIEDTPVVPIRSAAMGRIQTKGTAQADDTFPSFVSGERCCVAKVQIDRWVANRSGGHWEHYRTDRQGVPFYLEDETGRVRVDPRGCDLDVPVYCRREIGSILASAMREYALGPFAAHGGPSGRTDDELLAYAAPGLFGSHKFRFSEYLVQPGGQYDMLGTCAENPNPAGPDDHNLITQGQNGQLFLISSLTEKQLEQSLSWKSSLHVWGGAALSVACAATLVARHRWF